jgi:hypothetical protein
MTEQPKDAFQYLVAMGGKPTDITLMIPVELHEAVMALSPEERRIAPRSTPLRSRACLRIRRTMGPDDVGFRLLLI